MFHYDGNDHPIPDWLVKAAALDPEHTRLVLERMRDVWPADFIEMLEHHPWSIRVDWPQYSHLNHSSD